MGVIHYPKIDDVYLEAKLRGDKLFEIRRNDKGYQKGDLVIYEKKVEQGTMKYTYEITYVTNFAQKDDYVVFGEKVYVPNTKQIKGR